MMKYVLFFLLLLMIFSCRSKNKFQPTDAFRKVVETTSVKVVQDPTVIRDTSKATKLGMYSLVGDSVLVPPFEIDISLSPKAKAQIVNSNEKIVVFVSLNGVPKDSSKANLEEDGSLYVGSATQVISYGQPAIFSNLKFSKKIYDELANKDPTLTINVFSGRISSQNNLLDVDFFSDKISNVINKRITLKGKLMYGE